MATGISNNELNDRIGQVSPVLGNELKNSQTEIADTSLRLRYSLTFKILSSIFIILLIALLGMIIYLNYKIWNGGASDNIEKWIAISTAISLGLVIILMGVYYFYFVSPELETADRIATDILRISTGDITKTSLRSNLTSLVARRTGKVDAEGINQIVSGVERLNVRSSPDNNKGQQLETFSSTNPFKGNMISETRL